MEKETKDKLCADERLHAAVQELAKVAYGEETIENHRRAKLPSGSDLRTIVSLVNSLIYPGFFDDRQVDGIIRRYYIGTRTEQLYTMLAAQIGRGLVFGTDKSEEEVEGQAKALSLDFIDRLPHIKEMLYSDIEAMCHNDPAVRSAGEVIFCYPVVVAMTHHRIAHELLVMGVPIIPRIIAEQAHSHTGIDIHPGAQIGDHFCIDHGTGVVIGETCIIGSHVMLYQGVTLGAKNFTLDETGVPLNIPRHPIIEDNVTIYSNASVLGRITIGHDSVIGGNVWQTRSVPPNSLIVQSRPTASTFIDGAGI